MLPIERLISHRFRGFSKFENTIDGLISALDFGVQVLEFDIRVARCGTPLIYHDEWASDKDGNQHHIANILASEREVLGGTFALMPTAEQLFEAAAAHANQSAKLLIDIKDLGFEPEVNALVHMTGLQSRSVYVSWIPEVLYRMHEIAPKIPLCLSHWCQNPNANIRAVHHVDTAPNGIIPRDTQRYQHGRRSGWFVSGGLKGKMLDILQSTKGAVCVPEDMITRPLSDYYHHHGIQVSAFSFTEWPTIETFDEAFNIDLYFIDNKEIFEKAC